MRVLRFIVEIRVAGCRRELQGIARFERCCRVLQGVAGRCRMVQGVAGCCSVLQSVAGCCKVIYMIC